MWQFLVVYKDVGYEKGCIRTGVNKINLAECQTLVIFISTATSAVFYIFTWLLPHVFFIFNNCLVHAANVVLPKNCT